MLIPSFIQIRALIQKLIEKWNKVGHDRFLRHLFQLVIHNFPVFQTDVT